MKKTLLLTHEYSPYKGGVSRYVYNLFKYFSIDDYLVLTDNKYVPSDKNVINIRLKYPFIKPSWLFSFFKLKWLIKKYKIKQIFTPNILPLGSIAYFLKIPYVISLHGLDINLALKNKRKLTIKILLGAKKIIVNSLQTKNALKNLNIDTEKISLIYPSIDFDSSCEKRKLAAFKNKLDIKASDKILLTVGRLTKRKGQDLVINAINYIKNDFSIKYFIVGRGDNKIYLENLIKHKNLENRVFIYDKIEDEELVYFYQLADIFVMPSIYDEIDVEGFGIVFLEAAASHLPIIAGEGGAITEVFSEEEILLVKNGDLRELIRHIKELLSNHDFADKLADRALEKYKEFNNAIKNSDKLRTILN
ncbi:MAG: hypothetical protein C0412_16355 [Flavobacterium sp.]|nr:hypothetical protein [Flavobacterium sp.]